MLAAITPAVRAAPAGSKGHVAGRAHHSVLPHWLVHLGGVGLFAVAVADSSPIPLPLPGSTDLLLLVLVAHRGNPLLLAAAAILGSALGGYLTWGAGKKGGQALLQRAVPARLLKRLEHWATDHSIASIAVAAILPPPVPLTPFLLAAGALGVSMRKYMAALVAARSLRYGVIAWAAAKYGRIMIRWWTRNLAGWSTTILITFLVLLAGSIIYGLWQYRRQRRSAEGERAFA